MRLTPLLFLAGCPWVTSAQLEARFDADGDGWRSTVFGGQDCDDHDPRTHPDATEVWYDGVDEDCAGDPDDDQDHDGVSIDEDCDDLDPELRRPTTWYADADHDGFGAPGTGTDECAGPTGAVADGTDCDDGDAATHPGGQEVCGSSDEDCDGLVDDADPSVDPASESDLYADADGDGWGAGAVVGRGCGGDGTAVQRGDCNDGDAAISPGAAEVCDGIDDDCDEKVDDDDPSLDPISAGWYADLDSDTFGDPSDVVASCEPLPGRVQDDQDCDDLDERVHPAAPETCGGGDQDCDGRIDDADPDVVDVPDWFADLDGDGFGVPGVVATGCAEPPDAASNDDDCDDTDAAVHVGEVWYDGIDQDCAGDDDYDQDHDGVEAGADCDDGDPATNPGAVEVWYDGVDGDCAGDDDYDQDHDGVDAVPVGADCDDLDPLVTGGGLVEVDTSPISPTLAEAAALLECDGGVISVAAGTYTSSAFLRASLTRPVVIRGAGADLTTLDASWDTKPIVDVQSDATLESLTVVPSWGGSDALLVGVAGQLTLRDVTCQYGDAACIGVTGSSANPTRTITVEDSTFEGVPLAINVFGGGAALTITGSSFQGDYFGCVSASDLGEVTIRDTTFTANTVVGFVGVDLLLTYNDAVVLDGLEFSDEDGRTAVFGYENGVSTWTDLTLRSMHAGGVPLLTTAGAGALSVDGLVLTDLTSTKAAYLADLVGDLTTIRHVDATDLHTTAGALRLGDLTGTLSVDHVRAVGYDGAALGLDADATLSNLTLVGGDLGLTASSSTARTWTVRWSAIVGQGTAVDPDPSTTVVFDGLYVHDNLVDTPSPSLPTGVVEADPRFVAWSPALAPSRVDLHLRAASALVDAGDPLVVESDGSPSDAGVYGGPGEADGYAADLDFDGMPDGWELLHGLDPSVDDGAVDADGDGLAANREYAAGSAPDLVDTDQDGVPDGLDAAPIDPEAS